MSTAPPDPDATRRVLALTERELQRVRLDVHDGAVQYVYAALAQLAVLHRALAGGGGDPGALDRAERVRLLLETALGELRAIVGAVRPPAFDATALPDALASLALHHEATTDARVDVTVDPALPDASPAARLALYRAAQEALANATRHGRAARIALRVAPRARGGASWIALTVRDDGVGFDPAAAAAAGRVGLAGMRDRAAMLGGRCTVASRPGAGTTVTIEVPAT